MGWPEVRVLRPVAASLFLCISLGTPALAGPDEEDTDLGLPDVAFDEELEEEDLPPAVMDTGEPGDTDIIVDSDPIIDTTPPSAAEMALEEGGCHCDAAAAGPSALLLLVPLLGTLIGRRRR